MSGQGKQPPVHPTRPSLADDWNLRSHAATSFSYPDPHGPADNPASALFAILFFGSGHFPLASAEECGRVADQFGRSAGTPPPASAWTRRYNITRQAPRT